MKFSHAEDSEKVKVEELALGVKKGNSSAFEEIARRYENAIRSIAATFSVPEAERDDLYQEGLIALYRAVCKYDESIAKFSTFANVCIKRAMISWTRNHAQHPDKDGRGEIPWEESFSEILQDSEESCPEELYISKEAVSSMKKNAIKKLSDYEKCVFLLYLEDMSSEEIADSLGKSKKSIENALDRIRKKLSERK